MASIRSLMNSPRTLLIVGGAGAIGLAVAVPSFIGAFTDANPHEHPVDPEPYVAPPAAAAVEEDEAAEEHHAPKVEEEVEAPPTPVLETSPDGDVEATIKFRFAEVASGERVQATITLGNRSQRDVYLPAAGEPNHGLAVVVQDAEGAEVRNVVETAKGGQLPRRMTKLAAGCEIELPILVVADDETPLPPGTYTAYVELRPDARLPRLGLPLWTAPKGAVHSDTARLVVTAAPEK